MTAVIAGAFGAHLLKDRLDVRQLLSYETAVRYQLIHGVFLVSFALFLKDMDFKWQRIIYNLFLFGILLFSGSIYLLSLQNILGVSFKFLGPVTPIGGLLMISAWFCLGLYYFKKLS